MPETMLAGRLDIATREFDVRAVPVPEPRTSEVRVRVRAAGVCLSDAHLISGLVSPQRQSDGQITLGHEVAGTVDKLGSEVVGWDIGTRVTLQALVEKADGLHTLGVDYDGGWAEYVTTPASSLVPISDSLSFEEAAIIPDAVSTPWAAIEATAQVRAGDAVGVWGLGGLGAHAVQLLRMIGAAPIIAVDPLESARARALRLGADHAVDPRDPDFHKKIGQITGGNGFKVAFDFAGFPGVLEQAQSTLGRAGKLVLVGISGQPFEVTDSVRLIAGQQQILGHYGSLAHHVPQLAHLCATGRLDLSGSVSAVMPLSEAKTAVAQLDQKIGDPIRIVLQP